MARDSLQARLSELKQNASENFQGETETKRVKKNTTSYMLWHSGPHAPWKNRRCKVDGGHPVANEAARMLYFSSFTSRFASAMADSGYSFLLIGPVSSLGRRSFYNVQEKIPAFLVM